MDVKALAMRRHAFDWRDHWACAARTMVDREARVLTHDILERLTSSNLKEYYWSRSALSLRLTMEEWFERGPAPFLVEARRELRQMLAHEGSIGPDQQAPALSEWLRSDGFETLANEASTRFSSTSGLVRRALLGAKGSLFDPEPGSFLARIDAFLEDEFQAARSLAKTQKESA
ncbi:hypothetical protein [Rubellimicrobium mesophilum]|nr:hypothetical protein [Rubellimicrobium mesophilum]